MRAARIVAPRTVEIVEAPLPFPEPGQLRVRLEGCGVCASNVPPWEGREWFSYPMEPGQLGHEGWGRVDALGTDVEGFAVGDRVAFLSNHAYAEYDVVGTDAAVRLPDALDGVPFPGEPLGCAVNILRRSHVSPGDTVAIVGVGFLGALLTRLCANAGARVVAIARKEGARDLARRMGAEECLDMGDYWGVVNRVKETTRGTGADVVIEAVGKQEALDLATDLVREMGRLVVAGYHQDGLRSVNMQVWNWKGLEVTNAHEREGAVYLRGIEEAAEKVAKGDLDPSPLYTHRFPLEGLGTALDLTRERPPGFMKALVTFG